MNRNKAVKYGKRALYLLIMLAFAALMLMPIVWMFSTSLRLPKDSFKLPPAFFPDNWQWSNYAEAWNSVPYGKFILNSIVTSLVSVVIVVVITSMASYAFARLNFPLKNIIFLAFLSGIMIPTQSTLIPRFAIISGLNLTNTLWSLILPALIYPMGIFLTRQFMMTIPKSYDEAAYIDGAGHWAIFVKIIVPMSLPALSVVVVLHFLQTWNDFMNPLIFIYRPESMTLPIGLNLLKGYMGTGSPAVVLAGVMMSMVIPLLIYIFGQKYLLRGANLGGLKS